MGNIGLILGAMRNFHPQAQIPMINMLKYQRSVLAEPYGFAKLPGIFSQQQMTGIIERSMTGPKTSIRDVVVDLLKKIKPKVDKSQYAIAKKQVQDVLDNKFKQARIDSLNINFDKKKQDLFNFFQNDINTKNLASEIQLAKTPQELETIIQKSHDVYFNSFVAKMQNKYTTLPSEAIINQEYSIHNTAYNDFYLNLLKIVNNKSQDNAVIEIENILKRDFGVEFINLDNIIDAQKLLETVKIAKQKGVPIPQNIIISPFSSHKGRNLSHTNVRHSVILQSNNELFNLESINSIKDTNLKNASYINRLIRQLKFTSTTSPYHTYMHEFIHSETNPAKQLTPQPIDSKFDNIIERLSKYAFNNRKEKPEEVRTELRTKQVLESLNIEETTLLNILS